MQCYILGGLIAALALVVPVPMVQAIPSEANPFQIVTLAERGYLSDQGIPAGNRLTSDYTAGRVTARDVIQAAINSNRVSAGALDDPSYLRAVDLFLQDLTYGNEH